MSTFNDKVIATNAFLLNRIALRRVTNHEELQRVIGQLLFNAGRRSNPFPVSREKIIDALKAVDEQSVKDKGVLLSALVVHFMDDGITPRFYESAVLNGLLPVDASDEDRAKFHREHLGKVYGTYGLLTVPSDLSALFTNEDEDADEEADLDA